MKKFTLLLLWALCGWSLSAQNQTFFVDFGPNDVTNDNSTVNPDANGFYWNNVTNPSAAGGPVSLVDTLNQVTSAYVQVTTTFSSNGINHGGLLASDPTLLGNLAVNTATQDYFFTTGTSSIEIGGLDAGAGYVFDLFGTRQTTTTRITEYAFNGAASYVDSLQTSGADLGGIGYNGNNSTILVTDTLYPNAQGIITLDIAVAEGGFAYLGMLKMEQIIPVVETEPEQLIAVMGSSVADGFGATNSQGYAYTELLEQRYNDGLGAEYNVANISIGGNNTIALLNRWDSDLLPLNADYVIYGLSLGNEGIRSNGQSAFDQFRDNMLVLIERARSNGIEPVVVNCYARADFDATDYQFTKDMNELIHTWDVASINSLGAVDDRLGRWATGYEADPYHPNTAGHTEMNYTIVPSLFDALSNAQKISSAFDSISCPHTASEKASFGSPNSVFLPCLQTRSLRKIGKLFFSRY